LSHMPPACALARMQVFLLTMYFKKRFELQYCTSDIY
jgi:hypothetical protein